MIHITSDARLWNKDNWNTAFDWTVEYIGHENFIAAGSDWQFINEQDAVLFVLRWA